MPTRAATLAFARRLAALLMPGDVLLLEGDLGAGKSELARAMIQALAGAAIEVPSPTFTLVQTYATAAGPVTHADLYRIGDPDELIELGLDEAGILLVEWPSRAGPGWFSAAALHILITERPEEGEEARLLHLEGDAGWAGRLAPLLAPG